MVPMSSDETSGQEKIATLRRRLDSYSEQTPVGRLSPEHEVDQAEGWLQLGDLLFFQTATLDEAENAYRQSVALSPANPVGHIRLANLLLRRGQTDEAVSSARRARALAGSEGWVWSDISVVLAEGNSLDEAKSAIERAIFLEPHEPLHQFRLGEVLLKLGEQSNALSCFRKAAEAAPEIAWLQSHLGHALTEAGIYDEAQSALERAAGLDANDDLTRSRLALLIARRQDAARRARRSASAERSCPDFPIAACIVLAAPRTGSTVLGHSVGDAWHADFLGEVFHDEPQDDFFSANFFRFRCDLLEAEPSLSVPTLNNQRKIFHRYCEYLQSISPSGAVIMDLKYYSWHHLNSCFVLPHEPPTLIEFIRKAQWPVVHLVRENLFALHCSLHLSQKRGIWHKSVAAEPDHDHPTLVVDVETCRQEMEHLQSATTLFNGWFEGYGNLHHLTYERLFDGSRFSSAVEDAFAKIFREPAIKPLVPAMRKVTPPLKEVVENADEVLRGLAGTPFHSMAEEALA
jgi:tetratricopeptide (TPR) repeat protein